MIPSDIARPDIFAALSDDFSESDSLFYIDLWPFIPPLLLVSSPSYAVQACQANELGKPDALIPFLRPISGGDSLFTSNSDESKRGRSLFSPGFNSSYILNQARHVVHEAEIFVEVLHQYAKQGRMFQLKEATLRYTIDISGLMTMYVESNPFDDLEINEPVPGIQDFNVNEVITR
ncbi:uncharacterized protein LY89DRAFT_773609 [Mollisia scopiformis]|uniref:Uncharacterized protein n=1 Tax=Mollisia scopiformis TaxID=149040 RepID=A0A194XGQ9_MOLSC|nr:uncharacterized protein LY89DRAFT_773609 [Mollisia scopiformis]KUJ19326.1 hypothetical protein LY89DRAFT_773609 [Mollisia scopiformis]